MKLKVTPILVAVHNINDNPFFGDTTTFIRLVDEGGGKFIQLEQPATDFGEGGVLRLNIEELEQILKVAKQLVCNQLDQS